MGLEFSESCSIGIGNQLQKVTGIRWASKNYITFQTQVWLRLGMCNHLCISFLSSPPHVISKKNIKKCSKQRMLEEPPRRFVKWMLQQEEIRSRRNPPCQPQPTGHQTNWLIRWANSWCRCAKNRQSQKFDQNGICTQIPTNTYRIWMDLGQ